MKNPFCPLGQAIEHYQVQVNVSTYRIAQLTGLTEATLSRLKHGVTNPSIETLERIAVVLKVDLSEIIKLKETIEQPEGDSKNQLDLLK